MMFNRVRMLVALVLLAQPQISSCFRVRQTRANLSAALSMSTTAELSGCIAATISKLTASKVPTYASILSDGDVRKSCSDFTGDYPFQCLGLKEECQGIMLGSGVCTAPTMEAASPVDEAAALLFKRRPEVLASRMAHENQLKHLLDEVRAFAQNIMFYWMRHMWAEDHVCKTKATVQAGKEPLCMDIKDTMKLNAKYSPILKKLDMTERDFPKEIKKSWDKPHHRVAAKLKEVGNYNTFKEVCDLMLARFMIDDATTGAQIKAGGALNTLAYQRINLENAVRKVNEELEAIDDKMASLRSYMHCQGLEFFPRQELVAGLQEQCDETCRETIQKLGYGVPAERVLAFSAAELACAPCEGNAFGA